MFHPNSFLLGDMVDGLKNYYTPLYHVYFDDGLSRFQGMNFPYGEQIVFADAQPLLSNLIKLFSAVFDVKPYTVGILNFFMFLSIPIGALLLFFSFVKVNVNYSVSLLGSVFICLLTPQLYRFGGHFALSYSFVIPLFIWLYLRSKSSWLPKHSIWIGLAIWLLAGIHMYYFALGAFLFLAIRLIEFIGGQLMYFKKVAIQIALEVLMPFVLLQTWFFFTDNVTDRPNNPYGFLEYCSHWQSVFLPIGKNYVHLFQSVFEIEPHSWEGLAYVGLPVSVFSIGVSVALIIMRFKSKLFTEFGAIGIASILLLLFSFGAPFIWNLEWLVEYTGPLKQFRGVGRFAWVFFFVGSFLFFVWFDRFLRFKNQIFKTISISVICLVYGAEIYAHQTKVVYQKNDSKFLTEAINTESSNEFEAIIPVPFFHTGSENIWVNEEGSAILKFAFNASLAKGLPIIGVQMSRTSLTQTLEVLKLVYNSDETPFFIEKNKNYLIIKDNGYEPIGLLKQLIEKAELMHSFDEYTELSISGATILNEIKDYKPEAKGELIFSEDFETFSSNKTYSGNGALQANMKHFTKIYEHPADTDDEQLVVEFKYFMNKDVNPTVAIIEEQISSNGEVEVYKSNPVFAYLKTSGNWSTISYPVTVKKGHKLLLNFQKYTAKKRNIWVDELRVYKALN